MSIAIITASIGGIDSIEGLPKQTIPVEYQAYFDNNLPRPLPNLNNRLKSKYLKIQSHRFSSSGYFIWIDGRVKITGNAFAEEMMLHLGDADIALFDHPERSTVHEEYDFINEQLKNGNPYLTKRYADQCLMEEKNHFPSDFKLFACTVFIRKNTPRINEAFNEWWRLCIEYSHFDQCTFSYAMRDINVNALNRNDFKNLFEIGNHVKNI